LKTAYIEDYSTNQFIYNFSGIEVLRPSVFYAFISNVFR